MPERLPGGYVMEAQGDTRWIYPESAQDEVAELQAKYPEALDGLEKAFGVGLARELDVRIAHQASEMATLAPGHRVPDYATGVAYPAEGLILLSLAEPFSFTRPNMEQLFVHELSHVALHRAVTGRPIPRWFTEGVAIHQAGEHSLARLRVLWETAVRRQLQPIDQLYRQFRGEHHEVNVAYAQSADLVRHMLEGADDRSRFRKLIAALRDGVFDREHGPIDFHSAVRSAYGVDLQYIEREWRNGLVRRFGRWPSLLSGLTLLWGITAVFLLIGYIRARRRHHRTLAAWSIEEEREAAALQQVQLQLEPLQIAVTETPAPNHRLDEFMDRFQRRGGPDNEIPTIEHEGESHTLH